MYVARCKLIYDYKVTTNTYFLLMVPVSCERNMTEIGDGHFLIQILCVHVACLRIYFEVVH